MVGGIFLGTNIADKLSSQAAAVDTIFTIQEQHTIWPFTMLENPHIFINCIKKTNWSRDRNKMTNKHRNLN